MHLLPVSTVSLDEGEAAIDLAQPPGDVVVLSFADSDLSALAAAHGRVKDILPTLRLASLKKLRHPLSVDVYAEKTITGAKAVVVRCLGGLDYWRYGVETLSSLCRARKIALAVLPGDDRDDPRLAAHDTVSPELRAGLDACFRAGGVQNMEAMLRLLARDALGWPVQAPAPCPVPKLFEWDKAHGIVALAKAEPCETTGIGEQVQAPASHPHALILAYRSAILAGETAPLEQLAEALQQRGLAPRILGLTSLKDEEVAQNLAMHLKASPPDIILSTTAF